MDSYDELELRDPLEREHNLFNALRAHVARAKASSSYYKTIFTNLDPAILINRAVLAKLPILYKSQLIELQNETPPFGGVSDVAPGRMKRLFLSPGPIAEGQRRPHEGSKDQWRMARALHAAGFRAKDVIANCFSYHLTPAGFMFDEAAAELGCAVFPGGVGNTETQIQAILRFGVNGYVGTPDFLKTILEKADSLGTPISTLTKGLVTGGPFFPALRSFYSGRGIDVRQCYGTAELGLIAYETGGPEDGLVVDENCIVEIVRPGTGDPVPDGETGEVVVTTFDETYPLIRLATGDLSAVLPGPSPCGRTNMRLKGWMGRADQTVKLRGLFVRPNQVANIIRGFPDIVRARLEITGKDGQDEMRLLCEMAADKPELADAIREAIRAECRLRGDVEFRAPGSLPNDGKVIDDKRAMDV